MIKMANLLDFNLGGIQVMDIKKIIEWRKKKRKGRWVTLLEDKDFM